MAKNKFALHLIQHLLIGFVLILKGIDKIDHHLFIGSFILISGIAIIIYFFYTLFKKQESANANIIIHLLEAIILLFTAYIFYTEDKKYLPYITLLTSIGFFVSVFVLIARKRKGLGH